MAGRSPGTRVLPVRERERQAWAAREWRGRNGKKKTAAKRRRDVAAQIRAERSALFDEHVPAAAGGVHARARLPALRFAGARISGFSGGHRRERAGTRASAAGARDSPGSGARDCTFRILFHNPYQGPLAQKLAKWSGLDRVFFTNSGTEAIEGALKLARAYARSRRRREGDKAKTRILALENSFHGRTFGALSITHTPKYREPFEPLVPGVEFVRFNDVNGPGSEIRRHGVRDRRSRRFRARAAFPGQRGILAAGARVGDGLRRRADRGRNSVRARAHGAPFRVPEIRFAAGHRDDGKTAGGRAAAGRVYRQRKICGGICARDARDDIRRRPAGVRRRRWNFCPSWKKKICLQIFASAAQQLRAGLEKLAARFDFIREMRGEGLMLGVDLSIEGAPFVQEALRRGLMINCTHDHILRLLPPFIIRKQDVDRISRKIRNRCSYTRPKSALKSGSRKSVRTKRSAADGSGCQRGEYDTLLPPH